MILGVRVFHGEIVCRTTDPASCDTTFIIKEVPHSCPAATDSCAKDAAGEVGFPIAWIPESPQYSTELGTNAIAAVNQLAWQYMESGHLEVYVQSGETKDFRIKTHPRLKLLRRFTWHRSLVEEWAGYPPTWDRRAPYNVTWLVQFQWSSHHHRYELEVYRSLKGDPDPPMRKVCNLVNALSLRFDTPRLRGSRRAGGSSEAKAYSERNAAKGSAPDSAASSARVAHDGNGNRI